MPCGRRAAGRVCIKKKETKGPSSLLMCLVLRGTESLAEEQPTIRAMSSTVFGEWHGLGNRADTSRGRENHLVPTSTRRAQARSREEERGPTHKLPVVYCPAKRVSVPASHLVLPRTDISPACFPLATVMPPTLKPLRTHPPTTRVNATR